MSYRTVGLCIVTAVVLSGCVTYHPQPLEPGKEWAELESIRIDDLVVTPEDQAGESKSSVPAFDYSDGLSADEAAGLATVLNPDLRAFQLNKQIAEGQLVAAGLLPNPEIDLKWLAVLGGGPSSGELDFLFDLTGALLTRKPRIEWAHIRLEEVHWEVADQEWQLVNEVRLNFIELLYWDRTLELNQQQYVLLSRLLQIIQRQRAAGDATDLDVVLAEVELADIERQGKRLTGHRQRALQQFNRLIGVPPNHPTRLQIPEQPLAYEPQTEDLQKMTEQLLVRRPDLLQAEQAYLGSEKELQLAVIQQFPGIRLGPSYERGEGENLLGGIVSVEIPVFDRNQGQVAVTTAQREQQRRAYVALLHQARAELYDAWNRLQSLEDELHLYFSDVAPRLQRSLDLTEAAFDAGNLGLFQVLLLQRRVLDSKSQILDTLRDFHRAKIDLKQTIGPEAKSVES